MLKSKLMITLHMIMIIANLKGFDIFARIQNVVAYGLIGSLVIMGILGALKLGTQKPVEQVWSITNKPSEIMSMVGLA